MTRVVIVDDQALVRGGFRSILDKQPDIEVVGDAADGHDAVELCRRERPDVVLMDIRMPRVDGLEATRRLLAPGAPMPRVLILTTFDVDEYVYAALKAGASGFLLKDASPEALVDAVRTVATGQALLAPSVTRRLIEEFVSRPAPGAPPPAVVDDLTRRELEVLQTMARGLSNAEIAGELFLSEATVKTHVTRVLAKVGVRDRVQAVVFAYENAIVAPGQDAQRRP